MSKEKTRRFLKEEFYGWRCAEGSLERYLKCCEVSSKDEMFFETFKINPHYTTILEHVTLEQSQNYLNTIVQENPGLLHEIKDKFSTNDLLGSPKLFKYRLSDGYEFSCSPTTIRYVKVLSDLINIFGSLDNLTIAEIGGGYGGLATIISQKFNVKHYYNVDLKWPGRLAKKYTSILGIKNFTSLEPNQIDNFKDIDLVISNYAFSECNLDTRKQYIEHVFSKSKMGYITHNGDDSRRNETKSIIQGYINFSIFGYDSRKRHPIFIWNKTRS